jgi:RND family efflux transporter MFP subunit
VVIGVPEHQVDQLRRAGEVAVRLWAAPTSPIPGAIREVSPMADPATRTYTVKVAVPPQPEVRLGMTASVRFASQGGAPVMRVPLTALVQGKGGAGVWLVENGVVSRAPVQLGEALGNDIVVTGGVKPGQTVVTAGVHLLKDGQRVKILTADVARRADADALASSGAAR